MGIADALIEINDVNVAAARSLKFIMALNLFQMVKILVPTYLNVVWVILVLANIMPKYK